MKNNIQTQKAGNNSTQIQIEKIENHFDISIQEVRQIVRNEIDIALKENSLVAENIARKRLNDFSEIFLPKLVKSNLIDCFSDPAIQIFFRNTERTAICTDNRSCYEILSEILIHRVHKKDDFTTVAATNKAIEIADKISDDALLFLTIFLCVNRFIPNSGNIFEGLQLLDNLYGNILNEKEIPYNEKIIDNLEIVNAIRMQEFLTYKSFDEFFPEALDGYSSAGIDTQTNNYQKAKELLDEIGINESFLFSNSLIENHVRLNVVSKNKLDQIITSNQQDKVNNILKEIYDLYDNSDENKNNAKNKFLNLLNNYPNIIKVKNWWNTNIVNESIVITPIGRVLAHTNAKCLEPKIPDLD
ncbi:MAG: hypothetical protein E7313_05450 [Clostridiales bacterium]|nr:hypothetical protein [Clostridiales bacterium]